VGPHSVREYAESLRPRYHLASRRDKSPPVDELCRVTHEDRKVAIRLLRHPPPRARRPAGPSPACRTPGGRRWSRWGSQRPSVLHAPGASLRNCPRALERHDEVTLSSGQRTDLLQISPVTRRRGADVLPHRRLVPRLDSANDT
jgi:hypothetical protein